MNVGISIVVASLTAFIGLFVWFIQKRYERRESERLHKEALYSKLLESIAIISTSRQSAPLLIESQNAWLYTSDEVLMRMTKYVNAYTDISVRLRTEGNQRMPDEDRNKLHSLEGDLRLAIRKDLKNTTSIDASWVNNEWKAVATTDAKALFEYLHGVNLKR
jgi:hypothetical protein